MHPVHRHRVRYHEVDRQGYLFNGRFLELADTAMVEYFRALGWTYDNLIAGGTDPSVVRAELDFIAPALFDDELDACVECTRVGSSSFDLVIEVSRIGQAIARVALVYVNVDIEQHRSRPLPDDVASALRRDAQRSTAGPAGTQNS